MFQQVERGPLRIFELILFRALQFFQREGMADTAHQVQMTVGCPSARTTPPRAGQLIMVGPAVTTTHNGMKGAMKRLGVSPGGVA